MTEREFAMRSGELSQALGPDNEAITSDGMTEHDLAEWLISDACTLEAAGWHSVDLERYGLDAEPLEVAPLQTFDLYNGPGRRPPPEVLQLEIASASGDMAAVKDILQQWSERPEDEQINKDLFASSFKFAMENGHVCVASYLIDNGIIMNEAHFKLAMEKKSYSFLQLYLYHGFDINRPQSYLDPPPLSDTFDDEQLTVWFLDHGADPNAGTRMGITALSKALLRAPFCIIALLFDRGGPHSIKHGQLLHYAVYRETSDRLEVLEYLLNKGALSNINKLKYQDCPGPYEEENLIIGCGTPLHGAVDSGRLDVVKLLVAWGADPLVQDGKGRLAIEWAQKMSHNDIVEYLSPLSGRTALCL